MHTRSYIFSVKSINEPDNTVPSFLKSCNELKRIEPLQAAVKLLSKNTQSYKTEICRKCKENGALHFDSQVPLFFSFK